MQADRTAQAIVVGAGIVGLSTAYQLARRGWSVRVIDRGEPGEGCSAGNAGCISTCSMVPLAMPGVLKQTPRMLLDPSGPLSVPPSYWLAAAPWLRQFVQAASPGRVPAIARALHRLVGPALDRHRDMAVALGAASLIRDLGQLHVYPDERYLRQDAGGWALRAEYGVAMQRVDAGQIRELEPQISPAYRVGYFLPGLAAVINPLRYAQTIAQSLRQHGVTIERGEVAGLIAEAGRVTGVQLGGGERRQAGHVVVCAGAWSTRLLAPLGYRIPLESQRGYHAELDEAGVSLSRTVVMADRKIFITPMETGLRLAGTVELGGLDRPPNERRARVILAQARRLLPALDASSPARYWMGHRPCLPDSLPVLGAGRHEGLWLNFGHGHLGMTMAASSAALLAGRMRGEVADSALADYAADRYA